MENEVDTEEQIKRIADFANQHRTMVLGGTTVTCVPGTWSNGYDLATPALKCIYTDKKGKLCVYWLWAHELDHVAP